MDPIGTPLAVVAGLAWCFDFGCDLAKKWRVFHEADNRIREHTVQLNDHCIRLEEQTKVLGVVWEGLDSQHQWHFHDLTQMLKQSLRVASESLTGAEQRKPRRFQRLRRKASAEAMRYAFIYEAIEETVKKLESWHTRFDASFYLLTRIKDLSIDSQLGEQNPAPGQPARRLRQLRRAVQGIDGPTDRARSLPPTTSYQHKALVPFSSVSLAVCDGQHVLVDTLTPDSEAELDRTSKSIYTIGDILKQADANTFGLLKCMGILYQPASSANAHKRQYSMIFSFPEDVKNPTSLLALFRRSESEFSINDRLNMAKGIAKSLAYVHSAKFVHKNIRPETIIVFATNETRLGKPFLMGFEQFRPVDGWTHRKGDTRLEKHIYRHPSRQGLYPESDYMMQHDIYSLGVVLLEIGLWKSFVVYDKEQKSPSLLSFIGQPNIISDKQESRRALALKARLIEAAGFLPSHMGRIYTDVVLTCLNCLDDGDDNVFGPQTEFRDPDGVTVAVRFNETILEQLHSIII